MIFVQYHDRCEPDTATANVRTIRIVLTASAGPTTGQPEDGAMVIVPVQVPADASTAGGPSAGA